MHIPTGFWRDGLGDIDVFAHGDELHVFYLCIPSHDRVEHLVSKDGLTWREAPHAIHTGNPGEFDSDQIWTMGVFEKEGVFHMLYTGLSSRERGKVQRVGLATSHDLYTWEKYPGNPVACADPRWYHAEPGQKQRVDWRDPFVFQENGTLHAVVSARSLNGPSSRRGCAGHFTSTDGRQWTVHPPLHVTGSCYDFETPAICKIEGRYYLTGIGGANTEHQPVAPSIYRIADRVEGPYLRPPIDEILPGDNQVFKPCRWRDKIFYFHNLRGTADWTGGGGRAVNCLAPPKEADVGPAGELILRPFTDWEPVMDGEPRQLTSAHLVSNQIPLGQPWTDGNGHLSAPADSAFACTFIDPDSAHGILECEIRPGDSPEYGVVLRGTPDGEHGTFVSLNPALRRVRAVTLEPYFKTPSAGVTYQWRGRRVVQENTHPFDWGDSHHLRVVYYGPYLEVSLNERVLLSMVSMARVDGALGFFTEGGSARFGKVVHTALKPSPCFHFLT